MTYQNGALYVYDATSQTFDPHVFATRIKIETPVPANTEVGHAREMARLQAASRIGLQVVEETLLPVLDQRETIDGDGIGLNPGPNDSSVDRVLTTWWDIQQS